MREKGLTEPGDGLVVKKVWLDDSICAVTFTPCLPAVEAQLLKILDFQDAKAYFWYRRFSSGE